MNKKNYVYVIYMQTLLEKYMMALTTNKEIHIFRGLRKNENIFNLYNICDKIDFKIPVNILLLIIN